MLLFPSGHGCPRLLSTCTRPAFYFCFWSPLGNSGFLCTSHTLTTRSELSRAARAARSLKGPRALTPIPPPATQPVLGVLTCTGVWASELRAEGTGSHCASIRTESEAGRSDFPSCGSPGLHAACQLCPGRPGCARGSDSLSLVPTAQSSVYRVSPLRAEEFTWKGGVCRLPRGKESLPSPELKDQSLCLLHRRTHFLFMKYSHSLRTRTSHMTFPH